MKHPTQELYSSLTQAYDHFNEALFEGSLPAVIFVVSRQPAVMGHFSDQNWVNVQGHTCGEIGINPSYMAQSRLIEVMQTLVHEMVHCWQYCFGKPSRTFYHNQQWSRKMISIGLMPSTTGEPGGAITGQHMNDYVVAGGPFHKAFQSLLEKHAFRLLWVDRRRRHLPPLVGPTLVTPEDVASALASGTRPAVAAQFDEAIATLFQDIDLNEVFTEQEDDTPLMERMPEHFFVPVAAKRKTRYRHICPRCETKIYGKWRLDIQCNPCGVDFELDDE